MFVNQATGYLTIDIINAFVRSGKFSRVALIAGSIRVQDVPLDGAVSWSRIALYNRGHAFRKFSSWLWGTLQIGWLLLTKYRHYEVFYITVPPFAYLLSFMLPNRFAVLVFDVFPDVLEVYRIGRRSAIFRMWAWLNRKVFAKAHCVFTLGNGMSEILAAYVNRSRITVIPNWSGLRKLKEIHRADNFFLKQQGLETKFVVQYSGNIGYTHNVEVLVNLAKSMVDCSQVFFLIIGRGERHHEIEKLVNELKLANCRVLPFQPDEMLNAVLGAADLGVVILDERASHVSIPSKIYNLQSVGAPILGIATLNSELDLHLTRYANGACFSGENLSDIREFILSLASDKVKQDELRSKSLRASMEFTSSNALKYVDHYV